MTNMENNMENMKNLEKSKKKKNLLRGPKEFKAQYRC